MSTITSVPDVWHAFKGQADEGPIVMLNLLKFRPGDGAEAYGRYTAAVTKLIEARGGRVLYAGRTRELLVGEEHWDAIALIEYPSRTVFIEMVESAEYRAIHVDRRAGLERAVLYATVPTTFAEIGKR